MLNLSQLAHTVKSQSLALIPNPNHPLAQNEAYKQLKAAGWVCYNSELHPTDRVPLFRLGDASIRRNKSGASHWLLEIAGETHPITDATVTDITAAVQAKLAEIAIKPRSAAQEAADSLTAEYPEFAKRIAAALAIVEADTPNQYNTVWDNAGKDGNWSCDCPDSIHRNLRTRYGVACKHSLAGVIRQMVARQQMTVTQREVAHRADRRALAAIARNDYASPADFAPKADPLNTAGYRQNFNRQPKYGR